MTIVADASTIVALLIDNGSDGEWAADQLTAQVVAAPHLVVAEVSSVLRRAEAADQLSADAASLALDDLLRLDVDLVDDRQLAGRAWALRHNVSSYDGLYVALAEALDAPLVTLDRRLAEAPGPNCDIRTPS